MSETVDLSTFPRRIHDLVAHWAAARPDALALIDHDGRRLTWRDFDAAAEAMAGILREAGVRGGDRVLILLENGVVAAAALMACSRLDAWAVLLNARLAPPEIDRIRAHCEPRAVVFTDACSPDAERHADRLGAGAVGQPLTGPFRLLGHLPAEPEPIDEANAAQVAAMIYTSGTTGTPKGVMLTHRNVLFIAIVSGRMRALGPDDLVYAVLPISHVFGLASTFLGTVRHGGALQLVPRFDPAHLAQALREGVSVFQGVPAMYARLLEHLDSRGEALVAPRLRYMSAGGSPLDIAWKRRIEARFGIALNNGYGLTEAAPTVAQTRIEDPRDDDTIGPALPMVETRIVDPDGRDVPQGETGELWVRGPNVMKGYYRDAAGTAQAITPEGWLRTGDLARADPAGNLYLVGRAKELIIRSGFNVYPPEVETALNAHPEVVQAAVIGRRVSGNEEVVAFVETVPGSRLGPAALQAFVAERLAPYKRPQHVFLVERMPASPTGKIQKHALAALAEELIAARA
ncbi:MAG TPA: class I adenylate-forming enzyme family protein [Beijerinckiaceae bacterium]|nr:class I adenylate-forming enzyme family protein [Beijerinckiaceae bacterium]